jgi:hypothetical protein
MENVRNYREIELVTSEKRLIKVMKKPDFKSATLLSDHIIAAHKHVKVVRLRKPIAVGCCVLDLSKLLMYDFHYNYIVPKYGSRAKLLFTDTDSLCYIVESEDVYADMLAEKERFVFSNYDAGHPNFSMENKMVIGKMKDELAGLAGQSFAGLKAKMYSIKREDGDEIKKAKGVKMGVVKNTITHQDYIDCLFNDEKSVFRHDMNMFRNYHHVMYTITQHKVSLSIYDDKRYILDGVSSLAYGHKKIVAGEV